MDERNWQDLVQWIQQVMVGVRETSGTQAKLAEKLEAAGHLSDERMQRLWYALERIERAINAILDRR